MMAHFDPFKVLIGESYTEQNVSSQQDVFIYIYKVITIYRKYVGMYMTTLMGMKTWRHHIYI